MTTYKSVPYLKSVRIVNTTAVLLEAATPPQVLSAASSISVVFAAPAIEAVVRQRHIYILHVAGIENIALRAGHLKRSKIANLLSCSAIVYRGASKTQ